MGTKSSIFSILLCFFAFMQSKAYAGVEVHLSKQEQETATQEGGEWDDQEQPFTSELKPSEFGPAHDIGIPIQIPLRLGQAIVKSLKESTAESNNTTDRVENKAVLTQEELDQILEKLKRGDPENGVAPIEFSLRDKPVKEGMLNGTFTIYGRAMEFKNFGDLKTKIRMRIRTYLTMAPDYSKVKRSKKLKDKAFLEIKIKNPTPFERNGSHKYRILLLDTDVLKLFRSNPEDQEAFDRVLAEIKESALALKNEEPKVEAILKVVRTLATLKDRETGTKTIGTEFIKPQYATGYARESYTFVEKAYPFPTKKEPEHFKWYQLAKKIKRFAKRNREEIEINPMDIEYQLTIDKDVRGFIPEFHPEDNSLHPVQYFTGKYKGPVATYPENSRTIELKLPAKINSLRRTFRSKTHTFVQKELLDLMEGDILEGFHLNGGKSGHISRAMRLAIEGKPKL